MPTKPRTPECGPWQTVVPPCPGCGKAGDGLGTVDAVIFMRCKPCRRRWLVEESEPEPEPRKSCAKTPGVWLGAKQSG